MFDEVLVRHHLVALSVQVEVFEPDTCSGAQAALLVREFNEIERIAIAGRLLATARVNETEAWKQSGHQSMASWLSDVTGVPIGDAMKSVETSSRLEDLPEVTDSLRAGELSEAQANSVTSAATAAPELEKEILSSAKKQTVKQLQSHCRRIEQSGQNAKDDHKAKVNKRFHRHWTEADGSISYRGNMDPITGAHVFGLVDSRTDKIFRAKRDPKERESLGAYASDALAQLIVDGGASSQEHQNPKSWMRVNVDVSALRRGYAKSNEICEIEGISPIGIDRLIKLMDNAYLQVLFKEGTEIKKLVTMKRKRRKQRDDAVKARDQKCCVPFCDNARFLQMDHDHEVKDGGEDSYDNFNMLCPFHHRQKTNNGYRLVLVDGEVRWMVPGVPTSDASKSTPTESDGERQPERKQRRTVNNRQDVGAHRSTHYGRSFENERTLFDNTG